MSQEAKLSARLSAEAIDPTHVTLSVDRRGLHHRLPELCAGLGSGGIERGTHTQPYEGRCGTFLRFAGAEKRGSGGANGQWGSKHRVRLKSTFVECGSREIM